MARISMLIALCLPGLVACEGSKNAEDGGDGGVGDGGDGGGAVRATTCTSPTFTPGDCSWPEYCVSGKCVPPQNLNAMGMDLNINTATSFCDTSAGTQQGMGNLDQDRMIEDAGTELLAPDSAIITDLNKITINSDADCVTYIGHNTTAFEESANACKGGNNDHSGRPICGAGEAVMLFQGHAFDPQSNFAKTEGPGLDAQFYLLYMVAPPINFGDGNFGAAQGGFIIPAPDGGWSTSGGAFIAALCIIGGVSTTQYPLDVNSYPILLFLADTGSGADGGTAGNSYCTSWTP